MSVYSLIQSLESLREAISMTPEKEERAKLEEAAAILKASLRRRGVFIGEGTEPCYRCGLTPCDCEPAMQGKVW